MSKTLEQSVEDLEAHIASIVSRFENDYQVKVVSLNLDNRMRTSGSCAKHHVSVLSEDNPKESNAEWLTKSIVP